MNLDDILVQEADRIAKQLSAVYAKPRRPMQVWPGSTRYRIRKMYSSRMGSRGLYEMAETGTKFLFGDSQVKPDEPGGFVYGVWDSNERALLSVWPNLKLAENVLRLMQ